MAKEEKNIKWYLSNCIWSILLHLLPAKTYLYYRYKIVFGRKINWDNPTYFTEKLQWLKLYGFKEEYINMVDKCEVKKYVRSTIGEKYVIPTIEEWDNIKDIDINKLPRQFVLKTNHDSGTAVICKDKSIWESKKDLKKIEKALKRNYYLMGRETPYKYVKRKIIAEKYLEEADGSDLKDYKFLCFNGEPRIFKIDYGRSTSHHANFYSMEKKLLPFGMENCQPDPNAVLQLPYNFDEMIDIVKKLCKGFPFVRIDLYNVGGKIYFGEITFYPSAGLVRFTNEEWDKKLGDWIVIPNKNNDANT